MKKKACAEVGITSFGHDLPEDITQDELLKIVRDLNANPNVHGILVQLPLPDHIDDEEILGRDQPGQGCGRLPSPQHRPALHEAARSAICALHAQRLHRIAGPDGCRDRRQAGRSTGPQQHCRAARGHAVAAPQRHIDYLPFPHQRPPRRCPGSGHSHCRRGPGRDGQGRLDQTGRGGHRRGRQRVDDPTRKKGYRLVGDVDFEEALEVAGAITPVPKGVGPMTIAMLLRNTMDGAKREVGLA